jgi:hypothetical protein
MRQEGVQPECRASKRVLGGSCLNPSTFTGTSAASPSYHPLAYVAYCVCLQPKAGAAPMHAEEGKIMSRLAECDVSASAPRADSPRTDFCCRSDAVPLIAFPLSRFVSRKLASRS